MLLPDQQALAANANQLRRKGSDRLRWQFLALAASCVAAANTAHSVDADTAQDLAKASGCFKCHGIEKKKDGPSLRDAAAKFKGLPDAQEKLIYHVTSGEKVKFPDGHEEAHKKVKTQNPKETVNMVQWILSLEGGKKY